LWKADEVFKERCSVAERGGLRKGEVSTIEGEKDFHRKKKVGRMVGRVKHAAMRNKFFLLQGRSQAGKRGRRKTPRKGRVKAGGGYNVKAGRLL